MTVAPLPSDIYYARILNTYFGWNREEERSAYWESFAEANGYTTTSPPVDSPELRAEFSKFLESYKALGLTPSALKLGNSIPTNVYYSAILDTYFSTLSLSEKTDIWNGFVESQGYSVNPPDTASFKASFASYVKILTTKSISNTLNEYFGSFPEAFRIELLKKFTAVKDESDGSIDNISSLALDDTPATQAEFRRFIQKYVGIGITYQSIQMSNTIPDTPLFYQNYMNGFFGNLTDVEQTDIWNAFLLSQGHTSFPGDSAELQQAFANYINSTAGKLSIYENATLLSPFEMKSRVIFTDVMDVLKNFLNTSENLIKLQSASLIFYGKLQQNYTEMMTRVPNLTGGAQPKVVTNINDFAGFTFGYNKISLKDVIKWGIDAAMRDPETPFSFGNSSSDTTPNGYSYLLGQYSFKVTTSTDGVKTLHISAKEDSSGTNAEKTIVIEDLAHTPKPIKLNFDEIVNSVSDQYKALFAEHPSFISAINGKGGIPGRYLGIENPSGDDQIKENNRQLQIRSEINAVLQQSVENIRSLRDSVQTLAKQVQSSLNQSKDGLNQQTSLWTAILESIDNVMKAINKG